MNESKTVVGVNIVYLLAHYIEIIEDTSAILNPRHFERFKYDENKTLRLFWDGLQRNHLHKTGNWNIFNEGGRFMRSNETENEAYDRIDREYCEKTGHWELFIWNEKQKTMQR